MYLLNLCNPLIKLIIIFCSEYKIIGGEKELELKSKDIGKYYTNENFIFINEIPCIGGKFIGGIGGNPLAPPLPV